MLLMMWLNDDPSHPRTGAQVDAAVRTATKVAIVEALAGAVVLLIPLAPRWRGACSASARSAGRS